MRVIKLDKRNALKMWGEMKYLDGAIHVEGNYFYIPESFYKHLKRKKIKFKEV